MSSVFTDQAISSTAGGQALNNRAFHLFSRLNSRAKTGAWFGKLLKKCFCLLNLNETLKRNQIISSHFAGTRAVEIDRIRGTENKIQDFDSEFKPIKALSEARWIGIAVQRMSGRDLPPVKLVQVGEVYYVRDGHHRVSVAKALGQAFIDAEVTVMKVA